MSQCTWFAIGTLLIWKGMKWIALFCCCRFGGNLYVSSCTWIEPGNICRLWQDIEILRENRGSRGLTWKMWNTGDVGLSSSVVLTSSISHWLESYIMYSWYLHICHNMSYYVRFFWKHRKTNPYMLSYFFPVSIWQVLDAISVIEYLRSIYGDIPVHVVGISTGAIVASLLLVAQRNQWN